MATKFVLVSAAFALALSAAPAVGQEYPAKPVRIVVTFSPGGSSDVTARALAVPAAARGARSERGPGRTGCRPWTAHRPPRGEETEAAAGLSDRKQNPLSIGRRPYRRAHPRLSEVPGDGLH